MRGPTADRAGTHRRRRAATATAAAPEPLPHPVVDNHCHLDIADGPDGPALAVGEALRAGRLGRRHRGSCRSAATSRARAGRCEAAHGARAVVAGVALHPNEAPRLAAEGRLDEALAEIERLAASSDRVRAVGETGLDYFRTGEDGRAAQQRVVPRGTSSWRSALDKTLVIHDRDAHEDVCASSTRWVRPTAG